MSAISTTAQVFPIGKSSNRERIAHEAGHWSRVFTTDGIHPFDQVEWKLVDAEIRNPKGDIVYQQKDVEVPAERTVEAHAQEGITGDPRTRAKRLATCASGSPSSLPLPGF